jgi:hypothetical protein
MAFKTSDFFDKASGHQPWSDKRDALLVHSGQKFLSGFINKSDTGQIHQKRPF